MYVDPKEDITGVSAIKVRDFLHNVQDGCWTIKKAAVTLQLSHRRARELISELLRRGYIEPQRINRSKYYKRTLAGSIFSPASAAHPLTRKTAEHKVAEFIVRVHAVNATDYFLYRVKRVVIFGSYLTEKQRINDIDIGLELVPREPNKDKHLDMVQARISEACERGRRFSNIVDEMSWPYRGRYFYFLSPAQGQSAFTQMLPSLSK
jgi:predicted transcriptional regulator/predicted nucleotidyltransferase